MLKHHELLGDELHGAKISIEPPTRNPAFQGEMIFDGSDLWIAMGFTADTWRRSTQSPTASALPPPAFSWSLDIERVGDVVSIFYSDYDPLFPTFFGWQLARTYRRGIDLPFQRGGKGNILGLNSLIERNGTGLYLPVTSEWRALQSELDITIANPATATEIFTVGRFVEPGTSNVYNNARSLWVKTCQATVSARIRV